MLRRQFAPDLADALLEVLDSSTRHAPAQAPVAVFDADGTLWDTDASEDLLDWMDERALIAPPAGSSSLRDHSDKLCAVDRKAGYTWAATAVQGRAVAEVAEWADACYVDRIGRHVYESMAMLIAELHHRRWEVFVVSASPRWAVLPGAMRLGVPPERVLTIDAKSADA